MHNKTHDVLYALMMTALGVLVVLGLTRLFLLMGQL